MLRQGIELFICTIGIYTCYLKYGLLQERIYAETYGGDRFVYSAFLVAVQTAANALVAAIALALTQVSSRLFRKQHRAKSAEEREARAVTSRKPVPLGEYAKVALSYLSAMLFSFSALNHMSYPMQALGKSCKMIPVMLMGIVIRGKRYALREFVCVFLVTAGVALFSFKPSSAKGGHTSFLGIALLFASLFMDGITGPMQENLVSRYEPTTHELMLYQNLCSVAWLTLYLVVTGEGPQAVTFMLRHGAQGLARNIGLFALVSAVGQNFIFYSVRNFSALITTTITTTRKMFTVLLSIFVFQHVMAPRQWAGIFLVFAAIAWESVAKVRSKNASRSGNEKSKGLEAKSQ